MFLRHMTTCWRWLFVLLLLSQLLNSQPAVAASQKLTPSELSGFIDGVLATQMRSYHLAGAAVAIVAEGHVVVLKGYGLADLATGKPIDPIHTVFPLASLAKLFTATAVMQLVEQGKLDLNADINTYLGESPIVNRYPQPITLAHLLAHTAGFETRTIGDFTCAGQAPPSLEEFLAAHPVQQVRPPGEAPAYSNEGIDLAGYIVQKVSGLPYATYMQEQILAPLGMQQSSLALPVPATLAPALTNSYTYQDNAWQLEIDGCFNHGPSGGLYSSARDIARFMLAQLGNGQLNGHRILQAATAQQMHSRLYTFDPRVSGNAYGFWESTHNQQRMLYHFSGLPEVYSVLALLPQQQIGFFAVYNSAEGARAGPELLQMFLDHYFPATPSPLPAQLADFHPEQYTGEFASLRRPLTTLDELAMLFLETVQVRATATGDLITNGYGVGQAQWQPIGPNLLHNRNSQELLVFRTDAKGQATYLLFDSDPSVAYVKLSWYEYPVFILGLLIVLLAFQLGTFGLWSFYAFRHVQQRSRQNTPKLLARLAAAGAHLCLLVYSGILFWMCMSNAFCYGIGATSYLLASVAYLGALLLIGTWIFAIFAWSDHYWPLGDRVHYLLVAGAGVALLWLLHHWHMLPIGG